MDTGHVLQGLPMAPNWMFRAIPFLLLLDVLYYFIIERAKMGFLLCSFLGALSV